MNWAALYFLSILDNLQNGFSTAFIFFLLGAILLTGIWLVLRYRVFDHMSGSYVSAEDESVAKIRVSENNSFFKKWVLGFFLVAMCFRLASSAIPTKRDVVEAYAMIEGSKIITAQNGETMAKEVAQRFDKFLEIIANGGPLRKSHPHLPHLPKRPPSKGADIKPHDVVVLGKV
jgi:hypothetical protein